MFQNLYLSSLTYQLHASLPAKEFLEKETNRIIFALLHRLGISCTFPIALRHAPLSRMGLALSHLYTEAGVVTITMQTTMGQQMVIKIRWQQLTAGLQNSIFKDTKTKVIFDEDNWIAWLWKFLYHIEGKIMMESPILSPKNCIEDEAIMQRIREDTWTEKDIQKINHLIMYLNMYWLTDCITRIRIKSYHIIGK